MSSGQAVSGAAVLRIGAWAARQSPYCRGFANCTAAVASKQSGDILNTNVRRLWSALDNSPRLDAGPTLTSSNPVQTARVPSAVSGASSNYNAVFASLTVQNWHGLTLRSNLTFSRALGNGGTTQNGITSMDTFNRDTDYRPLGHDIPWVYNLIALYDIPAYFRTQRGVLGHAIGRMVVRAAVHGAKRQLLCAWARAPRSFGSWMRRMRRRRQHRTPAATALTATSSLRVRRAAPATLPAGVPGINMFTDPQAVYQSFRPMILGRRWAFRQLPARLSRGGISTWPLERQCGSARESALRLSFEFINVLNHFQPGNPSLNVFDAASWGVVTGQANEPRRIEFGLRIFF